MNLATVDADDALKASAAAAGPRGFAPLNEVYLAQARSLPGLLEGLLNATPPDSIERCELVARIENLLELFEPAVDEDEEASDQATPEAIAEANAGKTTRTLFEDL